MGPLVVLLVALGALIPTSAGAARSTPFAFDLNTIVAGKGFHDTTVEQQNDWSGGTIVTPGGPVVGLPGVAWSVNDSSSTTWRPGYLDPGSTASTDYPVVYDANPQYGAVNGTIGWWSRGGTVSVRVGIQVQAPRMKGNVLIPPALIVRECLAGKCIDAHPVWDATAELFGWSICANAVYTSDDPALAPIEGSNGGIGVKTPVTLTVANLGARTKVTVSTGVADATGLAGGQWAPGCIAFPDQVQHDYPVNWQAS
jgi:hypothetical protein